MEPVETAAGGGWEVGVSALKEGRVEDAITHLQAYVQQHPDSFEANNFLGVALAQAKRPAEALEFLHRATQLNPGSAQARYNYGLALLGNEQTEAARKEFTVAVQLDPHYTQAHQALQRLPAPSPETVNGEPASALNNEESPVNSSESIPVPVLNTAPAAPLKAMDIVKAWVFGSIAAIIGAFIWDKITYYTNYQIGLVAVGVGILVGMAVSKGAGGKSGTILKVMGALLSGLGILLGHALILMDTARGMSSAEIGSLGQSPILLFIISVIMVPRLLIADPLSLLFVAIGIWQGWQMAGATDAAPAPTDTSTAETSSTIESTAPGAPVLNASASVAEASTTTVETRTDTIDNITPTTGTVSPASSPSSST